MHPHLPNYLRKRFHFDRMHSWDHFKWLSFFAEMLHVYGKDIGSLFIGQLFHTRYFPLSSWASYFPTLVSFPSLFPFLVAWGTLWNCTVCRGTNDETLYYWPCNTYREVTFIRKLPDVVDVYWMIVIKSILNGPLIKYQSLMKVRGSSFQMINYATENLYFAKSFQPNNPQTFKDGSNEL